MRQKAQSQKINYIIIIIFIIGFGLRILLLGSFPPGLNQDEASIGYDSWAIMNYGVDRNGFHNPLMLVSWGAGDFVFYAYFSMVPIFLFGLNVFAIRIANALFACLSLYIFYQIVKKIVDKKTAVVALFIFTICPWHIMASRYALIYNIFPSLVLLGTYFLVKAFRQPLYYYFSFFVFSLSLYSYGSAVIFVPIYLFIVSLYLFYHKKITLKILIVNVIIFMIIVTPIFMCLAINLLKLNSINTALFSIPRLTGIPRYSTAISIFSPQFIKNIFNNFFEFIKIFFVTQNDKLIWNAIPRFGIIFLFSLPLLVFGLFLIVKENKDFRRFKPSMIFLIWFFVSIALGCVLNPNINRINIIIPAFLFYMSIGVCRLKNFAPQIFKLVLFLYIILFICFGYNYFFVYPKIIGPIFSESLGDAIQYAVSNTPLNETITITDRNINMPYIYVLFYGKIDPRSYYNTVTYYNPGGEFQWVKSFGRFFFGEQDVNNFRGKTYVLHNSEEGYFGNTDYAIQRYKYYSVAIKK